MRAFETEFSRSPPPATVRWRNAERVIADVYQEHIGSGSIWKMTAGILAKYFDNSIDHEIAKRMVWHATRIFVNVE